MLKDIVAETDKEFIRRVLSSDSRWRVTDDGGIVAESREIGGVTHNAGQLRLNIRIGPCTRTAPWMSDILQRGLAGTFIVGSSCPTEVKLPLWNDEGNDVPNHLGSVLIVGGDGIWIDIIEFGQCLQRKQTRQALAYAVEELNRILQLPRAADDARYWRSVLPAGCLGSSPRVDVSEEFGRYIVSGYINEGAKGIVVIALVDMESNVAVTRQSDETVEYVGWSDDANIFFPFMSRIATGHKLAGRDCRVEVRFKPIDVDRLVMVKEVSTITRKDE